MIFCQKQLKPEDNRMAIFKALKEKKESTKLESIYSENIFEKLGWNRHLQINEAERIFAGRPAL